MEDEEIWGLASTPKLSGGSLRHRHLIIFGHGKKSNKTEEVQGAGVYVDVLDIYAKRVENMHVCRHVHILKGKNTPFFLTKLTATLGCKLLRECTLRDAFGEGGFTSGQKSGQPLPPSSDSGYLLQSTWSMASESILAKGTVFSGL